MRVLDNFVSASRESLAHLRQRARQQDSASCRQDVGSIFHLAALVSVAQTMESPLETFEVNLMGTLRVLEAAHSASVRHVILASTCRVYGKATILPIAEGYVPAPQSPYAAPKLAAEQTLQLYTRLHGVETVVLRFFNVYGPRLDPALPYADVVPRVITALDAGCRPLIFGDGLQTRDLVGMIGELLGIMPEPDVRPARADEVRRSYTDIALFTAAGFCATTSPREGLAFTIEAFAHNHISR